MEFTYPENTLLYDAFCVSGGSFSRLTKLMLSGLRLKLLHIFNREITLQTGAWCLKDT